MRRRGGFLADLPDLPGSDPPDLPGSDPRKKVTPPPPGLRGSSTTKVER